MRIVYLAWHGSQHTRRWATFFAGRGHEVHVVTCGGGKRRDADEAGTPVTRPYAVHELGSPRGGKAGYLLKAPAARRIARRLRPDVLHAHFATSYGLLALAAGVHPLVVTAHGSDVLVSPRRPLPRAVVRRVLSAADLVTVPGEHVRTAVEELLGGVPKEVLTLQYGVETERLARLGERARGTAAATGAVTIATARPLTELYRTDVLVRAVDLLRRRGRDVRLEIAGDGPERRPLEALVSALGLADRVTLHGNLPGPAAERLIAGAGVYASLAASDGVSIALLEALALGAVPVLSDIPANRAWVEDGRTGVLTEPTPEAVAAAVERAAALDRSAVAAANARVVAERADRERNLGALEGRLLELVAR